MRGMVSEPLMVIRSGSGRVAIVNIDTTRLYFDRDFGGCRSILICEAFPSTKARRATLVVWGEIGCRLLFVQRC